MSKLNKILIGVILFLLLVIGITITVVYLSSKSGPKETVEVTSRTIIDRISDQYFIVTKTMVIDQNSTVKVDQGSQWSNFLWGQTINAEGMIRVDIGVDLNSLQESDVTVDERTKTVKIKLPVATILDASQYGDIEVDSKQGVLKYLLNNDPNADHNQALSQLIADAKAAAQSDTKVFDEARGDSINLIRLIVEEMGYSVEIE